MMSRIRGYSGAVEVTTDPWLPPRMRTASASLRICRRDHPIGGPVNGDHGGVGIDVLDGIDHRVPLRDLRRGATEGGHDPVVAMRGRIGHVEWTGERDDPRRAEQRPRTDLVVVQFVPGAAPDRELRSGTVPDDQLVVGVDLRELPVHHDDVVQGARDVPERRRPTTARSDAAVFDVVHGHAPISEVSCQRLEDVGAEGALPGTAVDEDHERDRIDPLLTRGQVQFGPILFRVTIVRRRVVEPVDGHLVEVLDRGGCGTAAGGRGRHGSRGARGQSQHAGDDDPQC